MKTLENQIEKIRMMVLLIGVLEFGALSLTWVFYPEKLTAVTGLCSIALCFSLGWFTGLLHAVKIRDLNTKIRTCD